MPIRATDATDTPGRRFFHVRHHYTLGRIVVDAATGLEIPAVVFADEATGCYGYVVLDEATGCWEKGPDGMVIIRPGLRPLRIVGAGEIAGLRANLATHGRREREGD